MSFCTARSSECYGVVLNHVDDCLQDWQKLVENCEQVLPTLQGIAGMERMNREVTPLLSATQQKQICTLSTQHHSRLQSQKQLHSTLQQAHASAGTLKLDPK